MFHLPVREMTIMLQDVAIILGLRIDKPVVTETCVFDVMKLCEELLDVTPPHQLMLSEDPLSLYGGYVTNYPPQHLRQMR